MRRIRRQAQVAVLASGLLLNGCIAVGPATQVLIMAAVVIGAYAAKTAIYQTVEVTIDEVVRPFLKKMTGQTAKDLVIHTDDPLRADLYGTFEFRVKGKEGEPPHIVGQVPLVRATPQTEWRYDPIYISRLEKELGGEVSVRQR